MHYQRFVMNNFKNSEEKVQKFNEKVKMYECLDQAMLKKHFFGSLIFLVVDT